MFEKVLSFCFVSFCCYVGLLRFCLILRTHFCMRENRLYNSRPKIKGRIFKRQKKIMANFSQKTEKHKAENGPKKAADGPSGSSSARAHFGPLGPLAAFFISTIFQH